MLCVHEPFRQPCGRFAADAKGVFPQRLNGGRRIRHAAQNFSCDFSSNFLFNDFNSIYSIFNRRRFGFPWNFCATFNTIITDFSGFKHI